MLLSFVSKGRKEGKKEGRERERGKNEGREERRKKLGYKQQDNIAIDL